MSKIEKEIRIHIRIYIREREREKINIYINKLTHNDYSEDLVDLSSAVFSRKTVITTILPCNFFDQK